MWRYDLGATHLVSLTSLKERRCYSAARELEGKIYVVGGYGSYAGIQNSPLTSVEVYDLFNPRLGWVTSRDKYNRKAPASMTASRWGLGLFALHGSLFAIGGKVQSGGAGATLGYTGTNEEYDIHLRTWTTRATMPTPRAFFASATHNCRVIVMGGITKPESSKIGAPTNIVEIYVPPFHGDPSTGGSGDYWYTPDPIKLPQGIAGGVAHNSALVLQGGQVYSMAGAAGGGGAGGAFRHRLHGPLRRGQGHRTRLQDRSAPEVRLVRAGLLRQVWLVHALQGPCQLQRGVRRRRRVQCGGRSLGGQVPVRPVEAHIRGGLCQLQDGVEPTRVL